MKPINLVQLPGRPEFRMQVSRLLSSLTETASAIEGGYFPEEPLGLFLGKAEKAIHARRVPGSVERQMRKASSPWLTAMRFNRQLGTFCRGARGIRFEANEDSLLCHT
jgi:hypothetical protein